MQLRRFLAIAAIAVPFTTAFAETKIGFVDLQRVIAEIDEGKAMKSRLESMAKQKRSDLEKERNQIILEAQALEKQAATMKDEVKAQKAGDLQKRQGEFLQKLQKNDAELAQAQNAELGKILDKLNPVVGKIAQDEGLGMVMERAALVYAAPSLDITNEVIRAYNSGAGKKAASDAPKKK